ncbi:R body protein RebB-like protein [Chromobacterium phragmitis]|uniref:RebB family R body protein n=1 Tax=Chromobacterium phragmitis TaxID=2202141 RepID=UPI000DEC06C8|nr:RebB family R body protein [Chromobacterium phragmitis]AXE29439.1 R body protein RebB-like protein [Chromobacterium phragmitis]
MAYPTAVNNQITDAVTQTNVKVLGESPAMAMAAMFQTMSHSTGILFENSTAAQQQQNTLSQAAANTGVMQVYSVDTMADAAATEKVSQAGLPDHLTGMLTALQAFKPRG